MARWSQVQISFSIPVPHVLGIKNAEITQCGHNPNAHFQILSWPIQDAAGVPVLILLFLLLGFGIVADRVVLSELASFLSSSFVLIVGPFIVLMPVCCPSCGGGMGFRPVDERWNSPGRPVIGFSSMYSPPYLMCTMNASSAARSSEASSFFGAGVAAGLPMASGIGVSGLDSIPFGRAVG